MQQIGDCACTPIRHLGLCTCIYPNTKIGGCACMQVQKIRDCGVRLLVSRDNKQTGDCACLRIEQVRDGICI